MHRSTRPRPAALDSSLFFAVAFLCALTGCAPSETPFQPLPGATVESQWEIHAADGDRDVVLTGAMAVSAENPSEGRLYLLLPMGQMLGKCVLSGGRATCSPSVPGSAPLLRRVAAPMAAMLAAHAEWGGPGIFAKDAPPQGIQGKGWLCAVEGEWLIYREERAKWSLRLKKIR